MSVRLQTPASLLKSSLESSFREKKKNHHFSYYTDGYHHARVDLKNALINTFQEEEEEELQITLQKITTK